VLKISIGEISPLLIEGRGRIAFLEITTGRRLVTIFIVFGDLIDARF
jgi:hypothetical protein